MCWLVFYVDRDDKFHCVVISAPNKQAAIVKFDQMYPGCVVDHVEEG